MVGVLGSIISRNETAANAPDEIEVTEVQPTEKPQPVEVLQVAPPIIEEAEEAGKGPSKLVVPAKKKEARRGRPLGKKVPVAPVEREKVSLRLRADLTAIYRDWSWKEQCQFSDLVDRALEFYWKSRGNARKPEKE